MLLQNAFNRIISRIDRYIDGFARHTQCRLHSDMTRYEFPPTDFFVIRFQKNQINDEIHQHVEELELF